MVAAATDVGFGGSDVQPPCRRAVGAAHGGSAAEPKLGGLCQLVRVVGLRHELLGPLAKISTGAPFSKTCITR